MKRTNIALLVGTGYRQVCEAILFDGEKNPPKETVLIASPQTVLHTLIYALKHLPEERLGYLFRGKASRDWLEFSLTETNLLRVNLATFSLELWFGPRVVIKIGKFGARSGVLEINGRRAMAEPVRLNLTYTARNIYNNLWGMLTNGQKPIYTPEALKGSYHGQLLAELLINANYGLEGSHEVSFVYKGLTVTVTGVMSLQSGYGKTTIQPYCLIKQITMVDQGQETEVEEWSRNPLLVRDLCLDFDNIAKHMVELNSQTLYDHLVFGT